MKKLSSTFVFGLLASICFAQRGKTNALTVSSAVIVNEYTTLTANANSGNTSITVANSNLNTNARFAGNLAAGDLIMIIQMQGATITGSQNGNTALPIDSTWGSITNYNNAGNYEFAEVSAVPNINTINLDCALTNSYTTTGRVQIIRVPRYTTLTINNGGSIGCDPWDSAKGGIVSIEVLNSTVINSGGKIDVSNNGFRGGALDNDSSGYGVGSTGSPLMSYGKQKGEGIAGYRWMYTIYGGKYDKGSPANGGGGGNCHNGGGGGGSNGGLVNNWINGFGTPDISTANNINAWKQEASWLPGFSASGGGRGGYTFSSQNHDPTLNGPNNVIWAGDYRHTNGGWGGRPLDYSTGRLFMGGGGGAGDQDDNFGGAGGNGAGMVYLMSYGTVSGTGKILANGQNGVNAAGSAPFGGYAGQDGAGGAGAGGTIVVNSIGNISGIILNANGGVGGNQVFTKNFFFGTINEAEGPGGGGGGGYIATSNVLGGQVANGGANGTTASPTMVNFPPNGATIGGVGTTGVIVGNFQIVAANDTICSGQQATLNASLVGTVPGGTSIEWYTTQTGGASVGSGASFITPVLFANTTYYVGTCPGTYRQAVNVVVNPLPVITINPPVAICNGQSTGLSASGGTSYSWAPPSSLSNPNIANPIATPTTTTTYTVSINTACGVKKDSVTITVNPKPVASINGNDTICKGDTTLLTASGGGTYAWSNGATTSSISVHPNSNAAYSVVVSNGTCTDTANVLVDVRALPNINIAGSRTICKGDSVILIASGGASYTWSTGATTSTLRVKPANDTTYSLKVSNGNCFQDSIIIITVSTKPIPVVSHDTAICAGNSVQLNASGGTSYAWGPSSGLSSSSISNPVANPAATTQYTVTVANGGCTSIDSVKIIVSPSPIGLASGTTTITSGQSAPLVVTPGAGNTYKWVPSTGLSCDSCLNPIATPTVTTTYYVIITDSAGCSYITDTVVVTVNEQSANCGVVFVPDAFSPNGDMQNDILYVRGNCIQTLEFDIFDRWGNKVFHTSSPNEGWDGKFNGHPMNTDTYMYTLKGTLTNSDTFNRKGNVSLIR